jgi:hypothetical protein
VGVVVASNWMRLVAVARLVVVAVAPAVDFVAEQHFVVVPIVVAAIVEAVVSLGWVIVACETVTLVEVVAVAASGFALATRATGFDAYVVIPEVVTVDVIGDVGNLFEHV